MGKIKFGTDGWRGKIADTFTVGNVARVTHAVALWLLNKNREPSVVVGYDTRFGGRLFAETVAKMLGSKGIKVYLSKEFVSVPVVSYGITWYDASLGIVITASHNSYEYNGYKLKGEYGGPLLEDQIKNIEDLIKDDFEVDLNLIKWNQLVDQKLIETVDLESLYVEKIKSYFELDRIADSKYRFVFDAMYGSGQRVMKKLLPKVKNLHCSIDPLFNHIPPEPVEKNLGDLLELMASGDGWDCGLAVDGDADRLALVNSQGKYVDTHNVLLLLIHCLAGYRKYSGKVVVGYSSTSRVEKLCAYYGLETQRVKIGFKEICSIMLRENVMIGGEESGGIGIRNHIPERDGIWNGLTIWQFMAETNKSLEELLREVIEITGPFFCFRKDIMVDKDHQFRIFEKCRKNGYTSFGDIKVDRREVFDGYKYFLSDDDWILIRPSGTEPKIRIYADSGSEEFTNFLLHSVSETLLNT
jgi:phosphomannomutase